MPDHGLLHLLQTQPISPIPIYYIHSFEQPFCKNQCCPCQLNRQATIKLFTQIIEGKLALEKAADLSERTV
jgi:hypothetical protein